MSLFFCGSNCDLGKETAKQLGIDYFDIPYSFDGKKQKFSYNSKFDYDEFYKQLKNGAEILPMTVKDYIDVFRPCMEAGEDVLLVHANKKLNPSYQNLKTAIEELSKRYPQRVIKRVDSYSISLGYGIIVYDAGLMYKRGDKIESIFKRIKTMRKEYVTYVMLENYANLEKIGKQPKNEKLISTVLNVKPILTLSSFGEWVSCPTAMGRKKGLGELAGKLFKMGENVADYPIGISYCNCEKDAKELETIIKKMYGDDIIIWIRPMSPEVSCLLGEGSLTLSFHAKKREEVK